MKIEAIKVGVRHRRDLGDIDELAASIAKVGLLHPIVVTPDGDLIAGERRLAACKHLRWDDLPVTVIPLKEIVRGEFAENSFRKDFTISEAVAIKRALEPLERGAAKERMLAGKPSENFSEGASGNALDKIADVVGKQRTTLAKAEAVVVAAEADPDRFGGLVRYMDESGRVDRAYKRLKIERAKERHAKQIEHGCTVDDLTALANSGKRFSVIYADPPWPWETFGPGGRIRSCADHHYDLASIVGIKALPVAALAADDCALLIWGTWPRLPDVLDVIGAWGFQYKTSAFVWIEKTATGNLHTGMGYYTRSNSEFCLLATKGSPKRVAEDVHQVVLAPVGEHSAKPEEVRRKIQRLFPGPYLELYGRGLAPGWTVWGNEIRRDQFVREVAA